MSNGGTEKFNTYEMFLKIQRVTAYKKSPFTNGASAYANRLLNCLKHIDSQGQTPKRTRPTNKYIITDINLKAKSTPEKTVTPLSCLDAPQISPISGKRKASK